VYIKTQKVGDRTMVHERSHYDLTLATSDEDGFYLIALVQVDDNLTPLAPGILCAKLGPHVDHELAGQLIDHLNALVDCWEMKWEPAKPGGPKGPGASNVIKLKKAA
jgi:hypothetical protein